MIAEFLYWRMKKNHTSDLVCSVSQHSMVSRAIGVSTVGVILQGDKSRKADEVEKSLPVHVEHGYILLLKTQDTAGRGVPGVGQIR